MKRYIKYIIFGLLINSLAPNFLHAQVKIDSLIRILNQKGQDTNRVIMLNELRRAYSRSEPLKSFEYAKEALELAKKLDYTQGLASAYSGLGSFYRQQGDYGKATEYQLYSLKYYEKLNKYTGIAIAYNNLGVLYYRQGNWKEAMKSYHKSLSLARKEKQDVDIATYMLNIGEVHQELQQYDSAIFYETKVIEISTRLGVEDNIAYAVGIIGQVYMAEKKYSRALQNELKALTIFEKLEDADAIAEYQADIAMVYLAMKNHVLAQQYAEKCLATAIKNESKQWQKEAYLALSKIAEQKHEFNKAHEYFKNYSALKDSIFNENNLQKIQQVQAIYDTEKKQIEIDLLRKDKEVQQEHIKNQTLLLQLLSAIGVLIIIFSVVLYRNNLQKQRTNVLLEEQKKAIKKKSENIESSIRYAQRIQQAFLPSQENLTSSFKEYFVFNKPRNIVSGDFYWLHQDENTTIVAVADCTGHGVPGALMSMMGNSLLNQIVNDKQITSPNLILDALHNGIRKALHQTNSDNRDGMDISILTITKVIIDTIVYTSVAYSGANNALIFFKDGQLQEMKANKMSIGGYQQEQERHFTTQEIQISANELLNYSFYLFTDGYQDQFGGKDIRKIGREGFRKILRDIHTQTMEQQNETLALHLAAWQGKQDQIDDILVMGFVLA